MSTGPAAWLDRLLGFAVGLVVVGLLFQWAVALLRPFVPIALGVTALMVTIQLIRRYQRNRYW